MDLANELGSKAELTLEEGLPKTTVSNEKTATAWFDAFGMELKVNVWANRGNSPKMIWFNTVLLMMFMEWVVPRMNNGAGGLPSSARGSSEWTIYTTA